MKRQYLFTAMASAMLMFTACGSNDEPLPGGETGDSEAQEIVLQVASSGDGLVSRAGRPLLGSEAKQTIENVVIIIAQNGAVKYAYNISDWNTDGVSDVYTDGGHGRTKTHQIPNEKRLAAGTYTVYAIGYHNDSDYTLLNGDALSSLENATEFKTNTALKLEDGVMGEELFAGSASLTVKAGTGFKTSVVLNRQVAGTYGYFKAIPYYEGATKLQLVASQTNNNLVLGRFANFDLENNGSSNGTNVNYVINGTSKVANDVTVYEIDLTKWFKELKDENNDGLIDVDGNWQVPAEYREIASFKKGSIFGGAFLLPFAKVADASTFSLQMVDKARTVAHHEWSVKLPSSDGQLSQHNLYAWNGTSFELNEDVFDTNDNYNVVRNHLYGIGYKSVDRPTNPTDPDNPDPEPGDNTDDPEPLDKVQELVLRVNDNWEVLHRMELDD